MSGQAEDQPAVVSSGAKQVGESRSRWGWVEPSVWTDRMLTALEQGVKGGKWFGLIDKVYALKSLRAGFAKVKSNGGAAGVDHQTVTMFGRNLEVNLERLSQRLEGGSYQLQAVRRVWIPKPGSREKRPLGIPTVRDRLVQTALRNVLEPIFERDFAGQSYGFRPGRGCKDALRRVVTLLEAGCRQVVDVDLKSYFDTIPRRRLMERVKAKVADGRVLKLLNAFLKQGVLEGLNRWTSEEGTPQGAVIGPLLADIYLDPLDHRMSALGFEMVRYADDIVVLCRTPEEAQQALAMVKEWVVEEGLRLHPEKTRVVDAFTEGFDFPGGHFERGTRRPRKRSLKKVKDAVRSKTRRSNGHSLPEIIAGVNRSLEGWFEYLKHGNRCTFPAIDCWVRMRLRSILRKRSGRQGRGRGRDHNRWTIAFFTDHGLFSLTAAYGSVRQSRRGG